MAPNNIHISNENPCVLIVEDDPDMIQFVADVLGDDYRLLTADNGKSALELLKKRAVNLVLSDYMMPEMDGIQLLEQIRKTMPDLPFIMLTARVEEADRLHALTLGVDDYMTKPFSPEELKARLSNLISRYQKRKDFIQQNSENSGEVAISYDQKWMQQLQEIVQQHIGNPLFSVEMLAERMNLSDRTLRNRIKAAIGVTPSEYISEARLLKARQLLMSKTYPTVSEVCFAVGFETPKYFSKLFKDRFGKLPSEMMDDLD